MLPASLSSCIKDMSTTKNHNTLWYTRKTITKGAAFQFEWGFQSPQSASWRVWPCVITHGGASNKSHYLCGPQGGIPAARVDASGTRHPRGFQPPCYLAHNRRDHQMCRDRNRPSLGLPVPNQCRGSSAGDLMVAFTWKQTSFLFVCYCREIHSTRWGWRQDIKDCPCTLKRELEIQLCDVRELQECPTCKGYKTVVTLIIWPGTKGSSSAAVSWLGDIAAGLYG